MGEFLQGVNAGQNIAQNNHRQRQQELTNYIKHGMTTDDGGNYVPSQDEYGQNMQATREASVENELIVQREKNAMLSATLNEGSMTRMVTAFTEGNVRDGLTELKRNPSLKRQLEDKGMRNIAPVDWANDSNLWENNPDINISPEDLQDPTVMNQLNRAFIKVQRADGEWGLIPTQNLAQSTGTMGYLSEADKEAMRTRFNEMGQILNGRILTDAEMRMQQAKQELETIKAKSDTSVIKYGMEEMEQFMQQNPNATLTDYHAHIARKQAEAMPEKPMTAMEMEKLRTQQARTGLIEQQTAKLQQGMADAKKDRETKLQGAGWSLSDVTDFSNKVDTGGFTDDDYKKAFEAVKANPTIFKTSVETTRRVGRFTKIANQAVGLATKIQNTNIDMNAYQSLATTLGKFTGIFDSMSATEKKEIDKGTIIDSLSDESLQTLQGSATMLIADYLNLMSGTAVTEKEFNRMLGALGTSKWYDKTAVAVGLGNFAEETIRTAKGEIQSVTNPLDIIQLSSKLDSIRGYKKPTKMDIDSGTPNFSGTKGHVAGTNRAGTGSTQSDEPRPSLGSFGR